MLGIYNYLCTILDVHHCRPSMYASRFVGFERYTSDPKIPTFCKFDYVSLLLIGILFVWSLQTGDIIFLQCICNE